jgi:hypothetical protein
MMIIITGDMATSLKMFFIDTVTTLLIVSCHTALNKDTFMQSYTDIILDLT